MENKPKKKLYGLFAKVGSTNYCKYIKIGRKKIRVCSKNKKLARAIKKKTKRKVGTELNIANPNITPQSLPQFKIPDQITNNFKPESVVSKVIERKQPVPVVSKVIERKKPPPKILKPREKKITIESSRYFSQKQLLSDLIKVSKKLNQIEAALLKSRTGKEKYICQVLKYKCYLVISMICSKIDIKLMQTENDFEKVNVGLIQNVFKLFYPFPFEFKQIGGSNNTDKTSSFIMKKLINKKYITRKLLFDILVVKILNKVPLHLANMLTTQSSSIISLSITDKEFYKNLVRNIHKKSSLAFFLTSLYTTPDEENNSSLKLTNDQKLNAQLLSYNFLNVTEWMFTGLFETEKR